jgi:hypothetical protein
MSGCSAYRDFYLNSSFLSRRKEWQAQLLKKRANNWDLFTEVRFYIIITTHILKMGYGRYCNFTYCLKKNMKCIEYRPA